MKIYPLNTGNFKLDGGAMFGVVPKTIWQKTNPADSNNMCSWKGEARQHIKFSTRWMFIRFQHTVAVY